MTDDAVYLGVDPGVRTGGAVLVRFVGDSDAFLLRHATVDVPKGDTSLPHYKDAVEKVAGAADIDDFVIEFPSAAYHGKGNSAVMIGVCRIGAELGGWGAYNYGPPNFVGADRLRQNGQVISEEKRPVLFERIYGEEPPNDHVRDAGLIVAFERGIF
jgi:hypothetical protein